MCLAVPLRVLALLDGQWAEAEIGGIRSRISTALIDDVVPGDYLIVHAGFAIARLDVREAELTLALFAQIATELGGRSGDRTGDLVDALPERLS
jgi:hydrogenase expression/formation protein HypC